MVDLIFIHFLSFQNMLVLDVQGVQVHKRQVYKRQIVKKVKF